MPHAADHRARGPWWWPQIALFWLELTAVYAGLTWLGRRFRIWPATTLLTAAVFVVAAVLSCVFIWGMEERPRVPGQQRMIASTVVLLVATAGIGCTAGWLLA